MDTGDESATARSFREECCVLWRITPFISPTKMTIYFRTVRSTNDNDWKTCKMSKVYARSHEITNKPCTVRVRTSTKLRCIMLRSVPQMLKKMKNRRKQNFEGEANNMQLDKEDTRLSNLNGKCVFNILILLFVFIMFNKLTCEVRFHIAVWSLSKCYKSV